MIRIKDYIILKEFVNECLYTKDRLFTDINTSLSDHCFLFKLYLNDSIIGSESEELLTVHIYGDELGDIDRRYLLKIKNYNNLYTVEKVYKIIGD